MDDVPVLVRSLEDEFVGIVVDVVAVAGEALCCDGGWTCLRALMALREKIARSAVLQPILNGLTRTIIVNKGMYAGESWSFVANITARPVVSIQQMRQHVPMILTVRGSSTVDPEPDSPL
jgi:hypothetical protein